MRRREFLVKVGAAAAAIPVVLEAAACGGDGSGVDAGPPDSFEVINMDGAGHTHSFTLRCSDFGQGAHTVMTMGGDHTHELQITGTQMAEIRAGTTVTLETNQLHDHTWIIRAPAGFCPL